MTQMFYGNQGAAFAGMRDGLFGKANTYVNDRGTTKQVDTITITATDSHAYAFTVNGISVAYTSPSSGTTIAIVQAALIAAYRAIRDLEGIASINPGTNSVVLTAITAGTGFTTAESDSSLALANTTANVALEPIPFGRGVVRGTATIKSARLPFAPTAQVHTLTATGATNATVYSFVIAFADGRRYTIDYTSDASATTAEISAGLTARVNALPVPVTAADTTDELTLTSDDPNATFTIEEASSQLSDAITTEAVVNTFLGVVERIHSNVDPVTPSNAAVSGSDMSVGYQGEWWVEVDGAVTADGPVYCRHTTGGTGTGAVGTFRADDDTARAFLVDNVTWRTTTTGAGLAKLALNRI